MAEPNLQIDIHSQDSCTIVTPNGDIDLSKSIDLRHALQPLVTSSHQKIIVDLAAVPYMDSSGVATLIEALQLSKRAEINFALCSLSKGVRSIIELARLDQIFTIYESVEQAIES